MNDEFNFNRLILEFAKRVAAQVREELSGETTGQYKSRLLTVEQAATYMGRTQEAMQHMIASGKIDVVRIDRRVFVDIRDLEILIDDCKSGAVR